MQTYIHRALPCLNAAVLERAVRKSRKISRPPLLLTGRAGLRACWKLLLIGTILSSTLSFSVAQKVSFNYAEALQKSLYFFDAQKSGAGVTGGRIEWRGDSESIERFLPLRALGAKGSNQTNLSASFIKANQAVLDPFGFGYINVSGGFHDTGDHVRAGASHAYAASALAWALFEYPNAFAQTGQRDHLIEELRWFADCFLRCTFRDSGGDVVAFCYETGISSIDHADWMPPEIQDTLGDPRPAFFASAETPASDQVAAHAAALAAIGVVLKSTDAAYSARCIETAQALYRYALHHRGLAPPDGLYPSSFYDEDKMSWAAVWLYQATGIAQYLTDIQSSDDNGNATGYLSRILRSSNDNWKNTWVHMYDSYWGGVFIRLAALTGKPNYMYNVLWNAEYWSGVPHQERTDTQFLAATPGGLKILFPNGGCNQYNCSAQFCALLATKYTGRKEFTDWALNQMDYIMGNNPIKRSYIVGFPTPSTAAQHPHHRAAHGSTTNSVLDPVIHRHILWGALVSGPDQGDNHDDSTGNFIGNEVGIAYNAALVGALAGLYSNYGAGQLPLTGFPPSEHPDLQPYFSTAKIVAETASSATIGVTVHAETTHPPQVEQDLSVRYFFDISELIAAGQSIADVSVDPVPVNGIISIPGPLVPVSWNGGSIYYVEIHWSKMAVYGPREYQFTFKIKPDGAGVDRWSSANDWSRQSLGTAYSTARPAIPVYRNGVRVFGQEPPLSSARDFMLSVNPGTIYIGQGTSAARLLSILRANGFTGLVGLSVTGLPSGVTARFATPVVSTSIAMGFTASSTAPFGTTLITITGKGVPGVRTTTLSMTITPPPN